MEGGDRNNEMGYTLSLGLALFFREEVVVVEKSCGGKNWFCFENFSCLGAVYTNNQWNILSFLFLPDLENEEQST